MRDTKKLKQKLKDIMALEKTFIELQLKRLQKLGNMLTEIESKKREHLGLYG
jgi:hypothetical protein